MREMEKLGLELKISQDAVAVSREEVRSDCCCHDKRLCFDPSRTDSKLHIDNRLIEKCELFPWFYLLIDLLYLFS